jgi:hypothetical protein
MFDYSLLLFKSGRRQSTTTQQRPAHLPEATPETPAGGLTGILSCGNPYCSARHRFNDPTGVYADENGFYHPDGNCREAAYHHRNKTVEGMPQFEHLTTTTALHRVRASTRRPAPTGYDGAR